jgi:two-component system NtrC family response regulator
MNKYPWPGNVRELENCVRRAVIMAEGKRVTAKDLELDPTGLGVNVVTLKDARETVERQMVQQALKKHGGKIAPAAVELGLSRPTLYELMDKLGISRAA